MDKQMDGQTDRLTDRQTDRQTDRLTDKGRFDRTLHNTGVQQKMYSQMTALHLHDNQAHGKWVKEVKKKVSQ